MMQKVNVNKIAAFTSVFLASVFASLAYGFYTGATIWFSLLAVLWAIYATNDKRVT